MEGGQNYVLQVAEGKNGIVGFACVAAGRDPGIEKMAEVQAIYLLEKYKGSGIGFSLLSSGLKQMIERGFKSAYCWVLADNPTIKFYERTGATFNGMAKEDEIGGRKVKELANTWSDLNIGEYHWEPLSVDEVATLFKPLKCQWLIAGGWAIDLFLSKQTRSHADIDVLIRRDDQLEVQNLLADWDLWVADPPGTLKPWTKGQFLRKGLQDIWVRRSPKDPWQIQIMLFDSENEEWIFKRDESIRLNLSAITRRSEAGISFLAPEVQLLYKSKSLRTKDEQDFNNVLPLLKSDQKNWLKNALMKVYKENHQWIGRL